MKIPKTMVFLNSRSKNNFSIQNSQFLFRVTSRFRVQNSTFYSREPISRPLVKTGLKNK